MTTGTTDGAVHGSDDLIRSRPQGLLDALLAGLSEHDIRWVIDRIREHRRAVSTADAVGEQVSEPRWAGNDGYRRRRHGHPDAEPAST